MRRRILRHTGGYLVILGILFFSFHSFQTAEGKAQKDPLELKAVFDKSTYELNENIKINFSLKNVSEKPVYVNTRFYLNSGEAVAEYRDIYLLVKSPSGEKLPCKVSFDTGIPRTDQFVLLAPGEEVSCDREKSLNYFFDFTVPGKYEIAAVYKNAYGKELDLDVYGGEIKTKPLYIEVVKK